MFGIGKKKDRPVVVIPEAMKAEDPVNYNSVLDYLVGLSDKDYKKMTGSVEIYRDANKKVAKLIGIKDEPTTSISTARPEVTDEDLDNLLASDMKDLATAFIEDDMTPAPKPTKPQATNKKVETE